MTDKVALQIELRPYSEGYPKPVVAIPLALHAQDLLAEVKKEAIDLKRIPASELKLDHGEGIVKTKKALPDLTAEQLKDLSVRTPTAIKSCQEAATLLSQPSRTNQDNQRLDELMVKINADVTFLFNQTHNYERPLVTDSATANDDGVNRSLDNSWQQLQTQSEPCNESKIKLDFLYHLHDAKTNEQLKQLLADLAGKLTKLEYPLSNLRTNSFTKAEQEEYERIKRQREGYFDLGKTDQELKPFRKQYELLKPYFDMVDAYKETDYCRLHLSTHAYYKPAEDELLKKIGLTPTNMVPVEESLRKEGEETRAELIKNVDKFISLYNDPQTSALENNPEVIPELRQEMLMFRRMARQSIKTFYSLRSFVPTCNLDTQQGKLSDLRERSNMSAYADSIWNFEDALKSKLKNGARYKTFNQTIDDLK